MLLILIFHLLYSHISIYIHDDIYIYICMIHIPMTIWINDVYIGKINGSTGVPTTEVELGGPDNTLLKSPAHQGGMDGCPLQLMKLTFSHLKMDGWNTSFLWETRFSGAMLVLRRVQLMISWWFISIRVTTMYLTSWSGWWQLSQFFFKFSPQKLTWENDPIWLIFFRWVGSTTN